MAYQPEPPCAAPYAGNAAVVRARVAAWRLAMSAAPAERIIADPAAHGVGGPPPMVRPAVLATAALLLFLVVFPLAPRLGFGQLGLLPRLVLLIGGLAVFDLAVFGGRGDGTRAVVAETQEEGLKWMEGMEIGHLGWGELRDVLLWHEVREGETATEQTRRGGRRLLLTDAVGRHLYAEERDEEFDRLLARVRLERPDLRTRVMTRRDGVDQLAFDAREAAAVARSGAAAGAAAGADPAGAPIPDSPGG